MITKGRSRLGRVGSIAVASMLGLTFSLSSSSSFPFPSEASSTEYTAHATARDKSREHQDDDRDDGDDDGKEEQEHGVNDVAKKLKAKLAEARKEMLPPHPKVKVKFADPTLTLTPSPNRGLDHLDQTPVAQGEGHDQDHNQDRFSRVTFPILPSGSALLGGIDAIASANGSANSTDGTRSTGSSSSSSSKNSKNSNLNSNRNLMVQLQTPQPENAREITLFEIPAKQGKLANQEDEKGKEGEGSATPDSDIELENNGAGSTTLVSIFWPAERWIDHGAFPEVCFATRRASGFTDEEIEQIVKAYRNAAGKGIHEIEDDFRERRLRRRPRGGERHRQGQERPGLFEFFEFGDPREEGGGVIGPDAQHAPGEENDAHAQEAARKKLESLGLEVLYPSTSRDEGIDWDFLVGLEDIQRDVEDIIATIKHPGIFEEMTRRTRDKGVWAAKRNDAVLFEGPAGTGKTTVARIIAAKAGLPMVHVPVESVVSKWYGESEKNLGEIIDSAQKLGAVIFFDEIDALCTSRDSGAGGSGLHEVTRRSLGVLLRKMDGFDSQDTRRKGSSSSSSVDTDNVNKNKKESDGEGQLMSSSNRLVILAATNRRQDLDTALLSRFGTILHFPLPSLESRKEIFGKYAKQLTKQELTKLAEATAGLSGREIKDICLSVERKWVGQVARLRTERKNKGEFDTQDVALPAFEDYLKAANAR